MIVFESETGLSALSAILRIFCGGGCCSRGILRLTDSLLGN